MGMRSRLAPGCAAMRATSPAFAQAPERPSYPWYHDWGWGWGHLLFGSIMMVVFWGGIILLIVLAGRWLGGASYPPRREETALDILKKRFARGEIDEREFLERKRHLSE